MEEPFAVVKTVAHPPPDTRLSAIVGSIVCGEFIGMFVLGIRYSLLSEYLLSTLLGLGGFYVIHGLLHPDS